MPGGDRTGPLGKGAMTGLGRGDCADDTTNLRRGFGFGRRRGFGAGFGRGWRWSDTETNQSEESSLKSTIDLLKNQLKNLVKLLLI